MMPLLRKRMMMQQENVIRIPLDDIREGYITSTGSFSGYTRTYLAYSFIPIKENAVYLWERKSEGFIMWRQSFWDENKEFISRIYPENSESSTEVSTPEGACYVMLGFTKNYDMSIEEAIEEFETMTLKEV